MKNLLIALSRWWLPIFIGLTIGMASTGVDAGQINNSRYGGIMLITPPSGYLYAHLSGVAVGNNHCCDLSKIYFWLTKETSFSPHGLIVVQTDRVIEGEQLMTSPFRGVMAAPNQCEIKAKVLRMEQSSKFPDKWQLELEILESRDVSGPNFARVGTQVRGFAFFASPPPFVPQDIITARAEFLGDEHGGQFQLSQVEVVESR